MLKVLRKILDQPGPGRPPGCMAYDGITVLCEVSAGYTLELCREGRQKKNVTLFITHGGSQLAFCMFRRFNGSILKLSVPLVVMKRLACVQFSSDGRAIRRACL